MTVFCSESRRPRGVRKAIRAGLTFFEYFPCRARHDEVIGVTHEVDFVAPFGHPLDGLFQPVQSQISQYWGNYSPLRSACGSRKQSAFFQVAGLEPLLENLLVHRDVLQNPIVANLVEETHDTLPTSETVPLKFA